MNRGKHHLFLAFICAAIAGWWYAYSLSATANPYLGFLAACAIAAIAFVLAGVLLDKLDS